MTKNRTTAQLYPEACRAAQDIHKRFSMPFPLNVSRLLAFMEDTYRIYDLSSQTYNHLYAQSRDEMLYPQKAWTLYSEELDTYLIVWNKSLDKSSIRYSVAHEIGHIVLHHERGWPTDRKLTKQAKEREANAFAQCLLAPFQAIWKLCSHSFSPQTVARYFEIPYKTAARMRSDYEGWLLDNYVKA